QGEANSAETPVLAAAHLAASARAAELAGEIEEAATGYDEALTRAPTAGAVLRARARLAESVGDVDEAHALWARLALAAGSPEERAFYGALAAEWTLARRGALPAVALDAIPAGPARALAVAEEALRGATPTAAAAAFAAAGRALSGGIAVAFLEQAARFADAARDPAAATAYRVAARKLAPAAAESPLARLREAARADARSAPAKASELLGTLPPGSALAQAVSRWAARLLRRRGDPAGALACLSSIEAPTLTLAAARDRLDLEVATGAALDPGSLARLRAAAAAPAAGANLTWVEAGDLVRRGEHGAAAAVLGPAIDEQADAVPLALLAEQIAASTGDAALRATALDLWLRGDSARRADAALALAATRAAAGSGLGARAALQTAVESAPESASFWFAAAADARAGRRSDAAATLTYGAEIWEASTLAPGLRAAGAVKHAPSDPARVLAALGAGEGTLSEAAQALGPRAVARLAERAADRGALEAALAAAAAGVGLDARRAWCGDRRHAAGPGGRCRGRGAILRPDAGARCGERARPRGGAPGGARLRLEDPRDGAPRRRGPPRRGPRGLGLGRRGRADAGGPGRRTGGRGRGALAGHRRGAPGGGFFRSSPAGPRPPRQGAFLGRRAAGLGAARSGFGSSAAARDPGRCGGAGGGRGAGGARRAHGRGHRRAVGRSRQRPGGAAPARGGCQPVDLGTGGAHRRREWSGDGRGAARPAGGRGERRRGGELGRGAAGSLGPRRGQRPGDGAAAARAHADDVAVGRRRVRPAERGGGAG